MEEDFQYRLSSQLIIFEKNSKEWEWSDLIKWLSVLKQILEKYTIPVPPDLIQTLSKRLGQCLSPSLPHGLHSKAFEIYNLLLTTTSFLQISVLSTGLFPHFQFCAPQNKPQYLELIKTNYIERFDETKFLLKGLLASLLEGANETPDTFLKVSEVLELCENKDKRLTFEIIWWFVLKSPKHRLAGLQYMQKKSDKLTCAKVIESALLEALEEESVITRRNALDYIRVNYPLDNVDSGIVSLVEGALKLLKTKDHTVIRRIWEWIYPNEYDEKQSTIIEKIIKPALLNIFKDNHEKLQNGLKSDEVKIEYIKIIENLCDHEHIGEFILKAIIIDIVEYTIVDELFWINGRIDLRIKNIVCYGGAELFWTSLEERFENLLNTQEELALQIILYGKQNFNVSEYFPTIVVQVVLQSLPKLNNVNQALEVLTSLIESGTAPEISLSPIIKFFKLQIKLKNTETLRKFAILFSKFQKHDKKIASVIKSIISLKNSNFDLGIILAIKFKSIITPDLIQEIWLKLDFNERDSNEIISEVYSHNKNEWTIATLSFIQSREGALIESSTRKFINFWDYMNKNHPQQLQHICRNTKIIYTMIDQLDSEDSVSALMAEEWLHTAKVFIGNIFDPIFKILLHESTTRDLNSDGIYHYNQNFDLNRVEKALKTVYVVVLSGGLSLVEQLSKDQVSDYCKSKCEKHSLPKHNYLALLIQLLLLFIQTPFQGKPEMSPSLVYLANSMSIIQDIASDILILVVKSCAPEICTSTLSQLSELLYKFIRFKTKIDIYLIRVIENMFQFNKPGFSVPSSFADCLVLGLRKHSHKIRCHWMKLLTQILPIIMTSLKNDNLSTYLQSIFESYFDIITKVKDFSLIPGLCTLINTCLNINAKDPSMVYNEEGKSTVKKQIKNVVYLAFLCYSDNHKDLTVLNQLIIPVKSVFLSKFVKTVYNLWKSCVSLESRSRDIEIIVKMTPNFQITAEEILEILIRSMEKHKNPVEEIFLSNFIQHILASLEKFKIPVSNSLLWTRILIILKRLLVNENKEAFIMSINILYTVTKKIPLDIKVSKEVQEIVKIIMIDNFSLMLTQSQPAIDTVYYLTECQQEAVSKKYLKTVHERGFFIFDIIWTSKQDREKNSYYIAFLNILIQLLNGNIAGAEVICELIQYFLANPSTAVFEGVKKNLMEFLRTSLFAFVSSHPGTVKMWKSIVNRAALTFFSEKSSLLLELMYECEPGLFGTFWSANALSKNLYQSVSLMCFVIFSSRRGMYSKILQGITDKIKEILKQEENIHLMRALLVLCKVLYLRLQASDFAHIRKLAWPTLSCYFQKYLEKTSISHTFEVLKFLDFILATNFDENCKIGAFLIDVPEFEIIQEPLTTFQPVCMRFLQGFSARPTRSLPDRLTTSLIKEKKLILSAKKPENEEDIETCAKSLIQYASCYSSERVDTDWNSIENDIEKEIIELA